MRKSSGKRIDLYNLLKVYKQLDGDAGKVNVGYIKSLDLEDLDEEIRRVRDFIADIQHFEPLIREQERLEELEAQEQRLNLDALQLQDLEDRLSGVRTRRASDVVHELEQRIARLEKSSFTRRPDALVELGRRGRDHLNSLIFDFLKAEEDERADRGDENKYVAVDVEDQFEFFLGGYGGYALFYCELEYIDMHTNREGKEKKVFYLPVDERKVKQKDGVFDERSILKNILSRDLSDLEEMDL